MRFFAFLLFCFSSFVSGVEVDEKNSKSELLSINGCNFYYHNKKFDFEWSVDRITKVLGESEQFYESEEFGTKVMYISWESIGITIRKYHYEDGRELSVFFYEASKPTNKPYFDISDKDTLPKVDILYSYQDQDITGLDSAVQNGAKGIVIAGSGNGSVPSALKDKILELMEKGIPVVRATRTGNGFVTAKKEGIGSGFFNPQKSRILLSLALSEGADMDQIKDYFGTPDAE
jgi:hypothetical protein